MTRPDIDALKVLVQHHVEREGLRPFARRIGLPVGVVRSIQDGRDLAVSNLLIACEKLGLEFQLGPRRSADLMVPVGQVTMDEAEFAQVPVHSASIAAGDGAENGAEDVVNRLAFRRDWLTRIGVAPSQAVLAHASGESMLPSIHPGDLLLIDRSRRDIAVRRRGPRDTRPSPIYAILDGGTARVKRIERPQPGMLMLLSDNPVYGPEVLVGGDAEALDVIGKVMWWGHTNLD